MFDVCCLLLGVSCFGVWCCAVCVVRWLLFVGCWLLVGVCLSILVGNWSVCVVRCVLVAVCWLLFDVCCFSVLYVCCALVVVCCLVFVV